MQKTYEKILKHIGFQEIDWLQNGNVVLNSSAEISKDVLTKIWVRSKSEKQLINKLISWLVNKNYDDLLDNPS